MATVPRLREPARPPYPVPLDQERIQDLLRLQRAAHEISSILDLDQLIEKVVQEVSAWFDCVEAGIYLRDADDSMRMAAVRGCTVFDKGHKLVPGKGMVGHVVVTGKPHYAPDVSKDPYYVACELRTRSEVAIPLKVGEQVIGAFTAAHHELDAFPPEQIRLLHAFCSYIAIAVQNAQRFGEERSQRERMRVDAEEARIIQEALLPKASPYIPGFSISGMCIPAGAVGGDWYDFIPLSDGRWGLVLADVSGKGMAAALLMSSARGMLRSLAQEAPGPGEALSRLNRLMLQDLPPGKFVTMLYAVFDPERQTITLANAGHPWPLLADCRGSRMVEGDGGLPVGFAQDGIPEVTVDMPAGSRLLLYTDGISENENLDGEEFGAERLNRLLGAPDCSTHSILSEVRAFSNGCITHDDATVILIEALKN